MAKVRTTDFSGIHSALNKMIIGEVKRVLNLVPGKCIKGDSLCHIVVCEKDNYQPEDVSVTKVSLDAAYELHIWGTSSQFGGSLYDEDNTDWVDIRDFEYLISQARELIPGDATHDLTSSDDGCELVKAVWNTNTF